LFADCAVSRSPEVIKSLSEKFPAVIPGTNMAQAYQEAEAGLTSDNASWVSIAI
jgi:hypothetical protein